MFSKLLVLFLLYYNSLLNIVKNCLTNSRLVFKQWDLVIWLCPSIQVGPRSSSPIILWSIRTKSSAHSSTVKSKHNQNQTQHNLWELRSIILDQTIYSKNTSIEPGAYFIQKEKKKNKLRFIFIKFKKKNTFNFFLLKKKNIFIIFAKVRNFVVHYK